MLDAQPDRRVAAWFAVRDHVFYKGTPLAACTVYRCGPMWLYVCRPEHDPDTAPRLHAERFLDAANDLQLRTPHPAERIPRRRQFARRAEQ